MATNSGYGNLTSLIFSGETESAYHVLLDWEAEEIARYIQTFEDEDQQFTIFSLLNDDLAADVFDYLELPTQKELIFHLDNFRMGNILNKMSIDDRTALFEELPKPEVTQLLMLLNTEERNISLNLLGYPEYSIGRLMTTDYVAIKKEWTVEFSLKYIRENGSNSETLNVIYVIDDAGKLIDDLKVRQLLLAEFSEHIEEIIDRQFIALNAFDDQEIAVNVFRSHNRVALPVIDNDNTLIGIVTIDDVLDVAREEDTEDIQKIGGVEALEEPYLDISLFSLYKKRAFWLVVLFLGEMLTATAMGFYESEIEKAVILSLFIPLIISSGGNTGSQAATLIIRAMALGEVRIKDWFRVLKRELVSGMFLGLTLAIIGFLRIALWTTFSDFYGPHWFALALTVSGSLAGVVLWGTLAGGMMPLILKRLGLDPATSSSPLVATMVDVTGLIIYFSIASVLLKGTLL